MSQPAKFDWISMVLGMVFILLWASAFSAAKIILQSAPPFLILAIRFFLTGLFALAIALLVAPKQSRRSILHLSPSQWRSTAIFGSCQNTIYLGLNFFAMQSVDASVATIIASTMPLLVALLAWLFLKQKLSGLAILGLLLGFFGVLVIMGSRLVDRTAIEGIILCVVAALALAVATLTVKGASTGGNLLVIVGYQCWIASPVLLFLSAVFEPWVVDVNLRFLLAVAYSTLLPGLLATWLWFVLVNRIGAVRSAAYHFLSPLFGVLVAVVLLEEQITINDWIGMTVVMLGLIAVQRGQSGR